MCKYCWHQIFTERECSDLKNACARVRVVYQNCTLAQRLAAVAIEFKYIWAPHDDQPGLPQNWDWWKFGGVLKARGVEGDLPRFPGLKRMETVVE